MDLYLEDHNLLALALPLDLREHLRPFDRRRPQDDILVLRDHQNLIKLNNVSLFHIKLLYGNPLPGGQTILLAARLDDCVMNRKHLASRVTKVASIIRAAPVLGQDDYRNAAT